MLKADHQINRLPYNLAALTNLYNNTIHPDNEVNRIKWSLLPFFDIFDNCTGYVGYRTLAYLNPVDILDGIFDISGSMPL
jgi:hypothetical protein